MCISFFLSFVKFLYSVLISSLELTLQLAFIAIVFTYLYVFQDVFMSIYATSVEKLEVNVNFLGENSFVCNFAFFFILVIVFMTQRNEWQWHTYKLGFFRCLILQVTQWRFRILRLNNIDFKYTQVMWFIYYSTRMVSVSLSQNNYRFYKWHFSSCEK